MPCQQEFEECARTLEQQLLTPNKRSVLTGAVKEQKAEDLGRALSEAMEAILAAVEASEKCCKKLKQLHSVQCS